MYLETPTNATLSLIPEGKAGIVQTLKVMSRLVRDGKKNIAVRTKTLSLISGCDQKDYACEVKALHGFVRDAIRYVQDINNVETVQEPQKTLEFMAGDCDDKSTLLGAMLESIGHPTRFMAIGFEPGIFSHVYVETRIGANWIPLETTEPVNVGWEPDPSIVRARLPHYN